MTRRIGGLVMLLALTQSTFAAERVEKGTILTIDLGKGTITDLKKREETALLDVNTFEIRRNETVKIEILQNLLLFTYSAKSSTTETPEFKATLEFARQVQALLALFPSGKGNVRANSVMGFDPEGFFVDIDKVLAFSDKIGPAIAMTIGSPDQLAAIKKEWADADFEATSRRLEDGYAALTKLITACSKPNTTITTDAGKAIRCNGPASLRLNVETTPLMDRHQGIASRIAEEDQSIVSGLAAIEKLSGQRSNTKDKALLTALDSDLRAHSEAVERARNRKDDLQKQLTSVLDELNPHKRAIVESETLIAMATHLSSTYGKIKDLLTLLIGVSGDLAGVGRPLSLATVPHSLKIDTAAIEVKASSKYDRFLDLATRKKRDGMVKSFAVVLKPYQPAHVSIAPALVLGFLRNPEFTVAKDGTDFKIQKTDEELTRYSAAVMINITPDKWQEPTFGGHFQLGVSPVKDAIGFFAGAGIRAQNVVSFGAGLMIQQVRKLAGGLTLDSRLDDPAKLKIDREFKRALYLHVTVEIPK